jgi:DNA-directed RNA polymerase specialized sigma24 family protein
MLLAKIDHAPVPRAERRALTLAAQRGDQDAFERLLADLVPNLRAVVRRWGAFVGEDAEAVALLAFTEAVMAYDSRADIDGVGVVALLSQHVLEGMREAADASYAVTVPSRTLQRFWAILRHAGGDPDAAERLAPQFDMTPDTFRDVRVAVLGSVELRPELATAEPAVPHVEDRVMAAQALAALSGAEHTIARRAHGFGLYGPESDGQIAEALGMSRQSVQRKRVRALDTMREALGVA